MALSKQCLFIPSADMSDTNVLNSNHNNRFTGPHNIKMENWISCAPFERYLGMEIIQAEEGRAILTMPFSPELAQGASLMHGGALMSLADTASGDGN